MKTIFFNTMHIPLISVLAFMLSACGDTGTTGSSSTPPDSSKGGSFVLFASQYEKTGKTREDDGIEAWIQTKEEGNVFGFSDNDTGHAGTGFEYVEFALDNAVNGKGLEVHQSYGQIFNHTSAVSSEHYFGLAVKAPEGGSVNVSQADKLVIQMGNGQDIDADPVSHNVFTVRVNGGGQNQNDFTWPNTCEKKVTLQENSRPKVADYPGYGYGLRTYVLDLSSLNCTNGNLQDLKASVEEVAVLVVGGDDSDADQSTDINTFLKVGFIGFSANSATPDTKSPTVLFASQYQATDNSEWKAETNEGGYVKASKTEKFSKNWEVPIADAEKRQSYGIQWQHDQAVNNAGDSAEVIVGAPYESSLNISDTKTMVIQMGNGANANTNTNTHKAFSVSVRSDYTNDAWQNNCSVIQKLASNSIPPHEEANAYGLRTYYIALDNFACEAGDLETLKNAIEEVAVAVGGNETASDDSTSGNSTLVTVGFIGFSNGDADKTDDGDGGDKTNDTSRSQVSLPVDFEDTSADYRFSDFAGGSVVVIDNPQSNGINTSTKVAQMVKDDGELWGGSKLTLDVTIDVADGEVFTVKVWSARQVPVLLKFEGSDGNAEIAVEHTGDSTWQELHYDFSGKMAALGDVVDVVFIFDNGTLGDHANNPDDWLFYFDDIVQQTGTPPTSEEPTPVSLPVDFEDTSADYRFSDFDGGSVVVIDNPQSNGINTSTKVAQMVKDDGELWGGSKLTLDVTIDVADGEVFTVKVWSARQVPVLLKFEGSDGNAEIAVEHTGDSTWQELHYDFSGKMAALGDVVDVVFIFDNGTLGDHANNPDDWLFYFDDIAQQTGTPPTSEEPTPVSLPVDFEDTSADYRFSDFDGGSVVVIDNPQSNGINTSTKVAQMVKDGGQSWGGSKLTLDVTIDVADGEVFTVKVWSARQVPVLLKFEGSDANAEIAVEHTGDSTWQTLRYDFSGQMAALGDVVDVVFIFDNGTLGDHANNPGDWLFYFDDIVQQTGTPPTSEEPTPDTAAADPTADANGVVSVFSDTYTDISANLNPDWSQATTATVETVAGGQVYKLANLNYQGIEFTGDDTTQDISTKATLHIDYWTGDSTQLEISLVSTNPPKEKAFTVSQVVQNSWQSLDIPLSSFFDVVDLTQVFQMKFVGNGTVFLDNIYFYGTGTPPTPPTIPEPDDVVADPTADANGVVSVFSDTYTDISANYFPGWGQATNASIETIAGGQVYKLANLDYQGIEFLGDDKTQDVSTKATLHIDYWTGDSTQLEISLVSANPSKEKAFTVSQVVQNSWQSLDIPLSSFSDVVDLTKIFQMKFVGNGNVFLDNIYFYSDQ